MNHWTRYATGKVVAVPEGQAPPGDAAYTDNFKWNVRSDELVHWISEQPTETLYRCIAWVPGEPE